MIVDGARADATEACVVLAECALSPLVAIGSSLVIESAADRPASVTLFKRGELAHPESATPGAAPRLLRLPIAGHAVAVSLDPGGVYELATADKDPETAWLAAPLRGRGRCHRRPGELAELSLPLAPRPLAVTAVRGDGDLPRRARDSPTRARPGGLAMRPARRYGQHDLYQGAACPRP